MIRDMSTPPVASLGVVYVGMCVFVCMRCIHSDHYCTARMNTARGYIPTHDNLIKTHKDKNRIKEGERNAKDSALYYGL